MTVVPMTARVSPTMTKQVFVYFLILPFPILVFFHFPDIRNDPQGIEDFKMIWNYCLDQGITVGAYKLDKNNQVLELIGVNVLFVSTDQNDKEMEIIVVSCVLIFSRSTLRASLSLSPR